MRFSQKVLPFLALSAVLIVAMVGCASEETEEPAGESAAKQAEQVAETATEETGEAVKAELTIIPDGKSERKTMEVGYLPPGRKIATMETTKGTITIELWEDVAPNTVRNFVHLANTGRYDNTVFHRVMGGFMAQGGDVAHMQGRGGPGYSIPDEFDPTIEHTRGVISMAHSSAPNSAGSQFFIMFGDATHLDGKYAAFGKVIEGMEVVDSLKKAPPSSRSGVVEDPDKIVKVRVESVPETEETGE